MEAKNNRSMALLLSVCLMLKFGHANFQYKVFAGRRGKTHSVIGKYRNISLMEDCAAVCDRLYTCISAHFYENRDGRICVLFASINNFLCKECERPKSIYFEIDVTKCEYGCYSKRDDANQFLPCTCKRNWNEITCEPSKPCPFSLGYIYEEGRCFKYYPHSENKTQSDAAQACLQEGAHLFTLERQYDADLLVHEGLIDRTVVVHKGGTIPGMECLKDYAISEADANAQGAASNAESWINGVKNASAWNGGLLPCTMDNAGPKCVRLRHSDRGLECWICSTEEGYFCQVD